MAESKAEQGLRRALEQAERGELYDKLGRQIKPQQIAGLKPKTLDQQPPERKREIQQAGAAASNKVQAKRRTIRDIYADLLQQPDTVQGLEDQELAGVAQKRAQERGKVLTVYDAIAVAMAAKAKAGDVKAAVFVRDSAGDKPVDQVQQVGEVLSEEDRLLMQRVAQRMEKNDIT